MPHCDNMAVVSALIQVEGKISIMLSIARNVWLTAAQHDIDVTVKHIAGKNNVIADLLSRWQIAGTDRSKLLSYVPNPKWQVISHNLMHIDYSI